jgi:hypothetical protein
VTPFAEPVVVDEAPVDGAENVRFIENFVAQFGDAGVALAAEEAEPLEAPSRADELSVTRCTPSMRRRLTMTAATSSCPAAQPWMATDGTPGVA